MNSICSLLDEGLWAILYQLHDNYSLYSDIMGSNLLI